MTAKIFSFLNTRVAKQFDTNFRKQHPSTGALSFLSDVGSTLETIRRAFSWDVTPEGFDYWQKGRYSLEKVPERKRRTVIRRFGHKQSQYKRTQTPGTLRHCNGS